MIIEKEIKPNFHPNRIVLSLDGEMEYCLNVLQDILVEQETLGKDLICAVKIDNLFVQDGTHILSVFDKHNVRVIVDSNLFSSPNSMNLSARVLNESACDMFTINGLSGFSVSDKAVMSKMVCNLVPPSYTDEMCQQMFNKSLEEVTKLIAGWAKVAGYGFVSCCGPDLEYIKDVEINKIVVGIRPDWEEVQNDDVKRPIGPLQARLDGADMLCVGRPILHTEVPIDALLQLNEYMGYI